jgi:hypothetical protein
MIKTFFTLLVLICSVSLYGQDFASIDNINVKVSKELHKDLSIYPNPTTDFFGVKHDENVKKVIVYNWIGKKIQSFDHRKGNMYNVENLEKGIYIVRLFDEQDKLSKVVRLHRN